MTPPSRDEVLAILKNANLNSYYPSKKEVWVGWQNHDSIESPLKRVIAFLESLPSETQRTGWIPVGERLPNLHQTVLCWRADDDCDHPFTATLNKDSRLKPYFLTAQTQWTVGEVTHWMPLPEAPK